MDLNAENISLLLEYMNLHDADIVIGSKLHPDSEVHYPFLRHILSYGYRLLTRILFNLSVRDTQVGLKLFRKEAAKDIFPRNLVKHFAFDIETPNGTKTIAIANPEVPEVNAIRRELEEFKNSIVNNTQPVVNEIDGYRAMEVAHQILNKINQNLLVS